MAKGPEHVVETDFLFGLRPSDRLHDSVTSVLEMNLQGKLRLIVSGASPVEANAVMASQGLSEDEVGEALSLIRVTLERYQVSNYTRITISDVQDASVLRRARGLSFFDSLHAAIATRRGVPVLSSNPIYRDLDIEWVDLRGI